MSIRLGVSPIAWINDDMPELGGDTPLETVFGDCRDLGFEGVELGGKFPKDPAVLKPLLGAYGLELIGGWYCTHLLTRGAEVEIAALQPHLALLEAMGSQVFIAAECSNAIHGRRGVPLRSQPTVAEGGWPQLGERLSRVADYVAARGFRFAYHHHLGTVVETPVDIEAFIANTGDRVGLVVDTGHAALGGIDPAALIRAHPGRVSHVHCKDVRHAVHQQILETGRSFLDGVLAGMFTAPGDGSIDFAEVMRALAAIDYAGWIVVEAEQDPALADPRGLQRAGPGDPEARRGGGRAAAAGGGGVTRMADLRVRPTEPDAQGRVIDITPQSANWSYVGFEVRRLAPGAVTRIQMPGREICVLILTGSADVEAGVRSFAALGGRASVFDDAAPGAVYVPAGEACTVTARDACEVAVCSAPGSGAGEVRQIAAEQMSVEFRGRGSNSRRVRNILPETEPAESLLITEVITPGGNWSSYPPHRHDEDAGAQMTLLEETYYHRLNPPQGFAFQRVYTDDRSLDETMCVEDGDVVLVPRGYHPVGAPHGYDLYYLNVMAGPKRKWVFHNDPAHAWIVGHS